MKSLLLFPLFLGFFYLSNCGYSQNQKNRNHEPDSTGLITLNDYESPFSKVLENAIKECIQYVYNESENDDLFLFDLIFQKEENSNCYLTILAQPFYFQERVMGYTFIDNKIITYNKNEENSCSLMVEVEKLIPYQDTIPGFYPYTENSYMPDLLGSKYQILCSDSLLLIGHGMF